MRKGFLNCFGTTIVELFLSEVRLLSVLMSKLVKKCQQKEQFVVDLVMLIFINFTIISLIFFQSLFIFLDISWYLSLPCSLFMFFSQVILYTYFLLHLSILLYDFYNKFLVYLILFICFFDNKLYNSFLYIIKEIYSNQILQIKIFHYILLFHFFSYAKTEFHNHFL